MLIEICLAIIALSLIIAVGVLLKFSIQSQKSLHLMQADLQKVTAETTRLLATVTDYVQNDLHIASRDAASFINNLNGLVSGFNKKSHSLNLLSIPYNFISSFVNKDKQNSVNSIIKWTSSGISLFNIARKLVKSTETET